MTTAWHFLGVNANKEPVLRDGRPLVVGEWLTHGGPVEMCNSGLHASYLAIDALKYAPGPWVSLCEVEGIVAEDGDKIVCTCRRPLWAFDATEELRLFARICASDVLHLWDAPDVVKEYLATGDEGIRSTAASAAAHAATRAAARAASAAAHAAHAAAYDDAYDAARAARAAHAAARVAYAAYAAARVAYAAYAAARVAARHTQNATLESLLLEGMV